MDLIIATFVGIDGWNRPVFKGNNGVFYCWTDELYSDKPTQQDIDEHGLGATNKGYDEDGEPSHFVKNVKCVLE